MGWREWLRSKDTSFCDYFERHAALDVEGAREFLSLVATVANVGRKTKRIKEIEHEADVITHHCVAALHKTFVTPIPRNDIHRLITRMDDVMDFIEAAAERIGLYELREMTPEVRDLAGVTLRCTEEMERAIRGIRDLKQADVVIRKCFEINRLENDADALLRRALAQLLKQRDAILVLKWKEIYELLETATDRCEDVANTIEGIVLEHA